MAIFRSQYIETEQDRVWEKAVKGVIEALSHTGCPMLTIQQMHDNLAKSDIIIARMKVAEICPRCSVRHLVESHLIIEYRKTRKFLSKKKYFCQSCRKKESTDYISLTSNELVKYRIMKKERPWPKPPKFLTVGEVSRARGLLPAIEDLWRAY